MVAAGSFLALFARAAWQVPAEWGGEWDRETTVLVASSVFHKQQHGIWAPMGYAVSPPDRRLIWKSEIYEPYHRQAGLIPILLSVVAPTAEPEMDRFLLASRFIFAALTSAAAALLIALVGSLAGLAASIGALLVLFGSHYFHEFARSPYWALFLPLAVVAWSWFVVGRGTGDSLRRTDLVVLALLVFIECLTGYEFVTTAVVMPLAVVGYAASSRSLPRHVVIRMTIELLVAGFVGFATAFAAHVLFLSATMGTQNALSNTVANAWKRSLGEATPLEGQVFGIYSAFAHDRFLAAVFLAWALCIVVAVLRRRASPPDVRGLMVASVIAVGAAASWLILARSHAALVPQYNMLPFYYGATILMGAFLAKSVVSELRRVRRRRSPDSPRTRG